MIIKLRNRGKESNDDKLFSDRCLPILGEAVEDMSYLLTRGYGERSSLQIVGNRYSLNSRQRKAIFRISSSKKEIENRKSKICAKEDLQREVVDIDGFNILILLECALSGAYVFKCRDGTYRDISSVHGSYKRVIKTEEAIEFVGKTLKDLGVKKINWYLDAPVSNSGRLKQRIEEIGKANYFYWSVVLSNNPDLLLSKSKNIVISSDGWILDRCDRWYNLAKLIIEDISSSVNIVQV